MGLCPICKKENGSLLLDRRLKDSFEMYTMTPDPCDDCKTKYLQDGVLLLNPENGDLVVIKTEAFKRIFDVKLPKHHIAFVEQEVLERLQPRE